MRASVAYVRQNAARPSIQIARNGPMTEASFMSASLQFRISSHRKGTFPREIVEQHPSRSYTAPRQPFVEQFFSFHFEMNFVGGAAVLP
jgi:hypothetical protein